MGQRPSWTGLGLASERRTALCLVIEFCDVSVRDCVGCRGVWRCDDFCDGSCCDRSVNLRCRGQDFSFSLCMRIATETARGIPPAVEFLKLFQWSYSYARA